MKRWQRILASVLLMLLCIFLILQWHSRKFVSYEKLHKAGLDSCQGCCSHSGGIICDDNGRTRCADGRELSYTCKDKGCTAEGCEPGSY
jgi:hypothetical protein